MAAKGICIPPVPFFGYSNVTGGIIFQDMRKELSLKSAANVKSLNLLEVEGAQLIKQNSFIRESDATDEVCVTLDHDDLEKKSCKDRCGRVCSKKVGRSTDDSEQVDDFIFGIEDHYYGLCQADNSCLMFPLPTNEETKEFEYSSVIFKFMTDTFESCPGDDFGDFLGNEPILKPKLDETRRLGNDSHNGREGGGPKGQLRQRSLTSSSTTTTADDDKLLDVGSGQQRRVLKKGKDKDDAKVKIATTEIAATEISTTETATANFLSDSTAEICVDVNFEKFKTCENRCGQACMIGEGDLLTASFGICAGECILFQHGMSTRDVFDFASKRGKECDALMRKHAEIQDALMRKHAEIQVAQKAEIQVAHKVQEGQAQSAFPYQAIIDSIINLLEMILFSLSTSRDIIPYRGIIPTFLATSTLGMYDNIHAFYTQNRPVFYSEGSTNAFTGFINMVSTLGFGSSGVSAEAVMSILNVANPESLAQFGPLQILQYTDLLPVISTMIITEALGLFDSIVTVIMAQQNFICEN